MATEVLNGKVIVITGASSGFGKGCALEFARLGARLSLAARREELLDELAKECEQAGATALAVRADVGKLEDVESLAAETLAHFGRIDVWVNNAGAGAIGLFEEVPIEDHIKVIETDLLGTLYGSFFAMRQFKKQNSGTLINVSSVLGELPNPYYASYVAAKHGVNGLSASLRLELESRDISTIHVCTVMPTSTDTPFFEHAANYTGHEFRPTPPVYEPEDVIRTIVEMATDPQDEVGVGVSASAAIFAHRMAPGMTESRFGSKTHETLQEAPPAADTAGSLHHPTSEGVEIKGSRRPNA